LVLSAIETRTICESFHKRILYFCIR